MIKEVTIWFATSSPVRLKTAEEALKLTVSGINPAILGYREGIGAPSVVAFEKALAVLFYLVSPELQSVILQLLSEDSFTPSENEASIPEIPTDQPLWILASDVLVSFASDSTTRGKPLHLLDRQRQKLGANATPKQLRKLLNDDRQALEATLTAVDGFFVEWVVACSLISFHEGVVETATFETTIRAKLPPLTADELDETYRLDNENVWYIGPRVDAASLLESAQSIQILTQDRIWQSTNEAVARALVLGGTPPIEWIKELFLNSKPIKSDELTAASASLVSPLSYAEQFAVQQTS